MVLGMVERICWESVCEFLSAMENALANKEEPCKSACLVVAINEKPFHLTLIFRRPIPEARGKARRFDYDYGRAGVASIFVFTEPLVGGRLVNFRNRRTKVDWALEVANLLGTRYAKANKVILCVTTPTPKRPAPYLMPFRRSRPVSWSGASSFGTPRNTRDDVLG